MSEARDDSRLFGARRVCWAKALLLGAFVACVLTGPHRASACAECRARCFANDGTNVKKGETPKLKDDPILLYDGSVTEQVTDLSLPGVTFGWSHTRSYNSSLRGSVVQGGGWMANWLTCFLHEKVNDDVELYVNHLIKRVFTRVGEEAPYSYTAPDDYHATLEADTVDTIDCFKLTLTQTGRTHWYYDFSHAVDKQGLLYKVTDRYGNEEMTYAYDAGRLISVTTTQGWNVTYDYISGVSPNPGKLDSIVVKNATGTEIIQKARYTYATSSTDCGSYGDLIMVRVFKRATKDELTQSGDSDFSIKRTWMYRYYTSSSDGKTHQLKTVFNPASVERAMADAGITNPATLLSRGDSTPVDGAEGSKPHMKTYANVAYTYYTTDFATDDLETKYGGSNLDEYDDANSIGFVKSQIIYKDYKGCLGTHTYFYMANHEEGTNLNAVTRIVVVDTAETGTREIYGLSKDRQSLREVFVDDPDETPKYWCKSFVLGETKDESTNNVNKPIEIRMPSAHDCIDSDEEVATFLEADGAANEWTAAILNESSGVVYTYAYNVEGYLTDEMVKKGGSGTAYYLRAADYGTGGDNEPKYLPTASYVYTIAGEARGGSRLTTTYAYSFHDAANVAQQIKTRTITYPTVAATQNGSGSATITSKEYYDDSGRLRWTKDGEGYVNYYSYHRETGALAYVSVDVNAVTNGLPLDIQNGDDPKWEDWGSNDPPSGFARESGLPTPLALVTKVEYDDLGRQIKVEDAEGMITATAYCDNEARVYPGWDMDEHTPALPIRVTKVNDDDLTTEVFTVDPGGLTTIGHSDHLPTGNDVGQDQDDYITWTKYHYEQWDAEESVTAYHTALLEKVDRHHKIHSSEYGTLSVNFHRTVYRYDGLGRRTHVIQVASGNDPAATDPSGCVEQVTKIVYDALGRVSETQRGVSARTHAMEADYSSDPTLKRVVAAFYDESDPGTHSTAGEGDGRVTSSVRYYDTPAPIDYDTNGVKVVYHRNWRGQLRGVEPEAPPYTVRDVDNMGRLVAVARYVSEPTWSNGTDGVIEDDDYAADPSNKTGRRSLAETHYDSMGRVYRTKTYAVQQDGDPGDLDEKIVADNYYDRNSRLVGRYSPARGGLEYAYDGAGRRTEVRLVTDLESPKYSSGAFCYRNPKPGDTSGDDDDGDDGVIQMSRTVYDKVGNVTESIRMEVNHDDTDGLLITSGSEDFVQTAVYHWYETNTHRRTTTAVFGTGKASAPFWEHNSLSRPGSEPSGSGNDGLVTKYDYDRGRLQKVTNPKAIDTFFAYDDLGRRTKVEEADGEDEERWTLTTYDGLSNVVYQTADLDEDEDPEPTDQRTTYTYGDLYDASLVTKIKRPDEDDADNNVELEYHLDGQVKKRTLQELSGESNRPEIEFIYDTTFHRLTEQHVTPNGVDTTVQSVKFAYDSLGRRQTVTSYPTTGCTGTPLNEVKYTYNDFGALDQEYQEHEGAVDANSLYVQYAYDITTGTYNEIENVYTKGVRFKSFRYPCVGSTWKVRSGGDDAARLVYSLYKDTKDEDPWDQTGIGDKISRVTAVARDDSRGSEAENDNVLSAYSYNGVGRLVVEDFTQPEVRLDYYGGAAGTYAGLDRLGRIKTQLWRDYGASQDRDKYTYDYDHNSNRKYRENNVTGDKKDELYAYDNLDRLTEFKRGNLNVGKTAIPTADTNRVRGEAWTLTDFGNWSAYKIDYDGDGYDDNDGDLTQSREHNLVNETTGIDETKGPSWADPGYSARGNMITVPKPTALTATYKCSYDAWNRLVEVKEQNDNVVAKFEYDGLGRRTKKFINTGEDQTYDHFRHFYYNAGWQIVETRKSTSGENTEPQTLRPEYQYVWGRRYIDAPILRDENKDSDDYCNEPNDDERLYYLTDANMNVTTLTDTAGDAVERCLYDPYGKVTFMDGSWENAAGESAKDNAILFAGYWRDSDTGLYHVRHRAYHPNLGRWLQRDPLGYVDSMSLYEYCASRPLSCADPFGELVIYAEGAVHCKKAKKKGAEGLLELSLAAHVALEDFAKTVPHKEGQAGYMWVHHHATDEYSGAWNDKQQIDDNASKMAAEMIFNTDPDEDILIFAHSTGAATALQALKFLKYHNWWIDVQLQNEKLKPKEREALRKQKRHVKGLIVYGGSGIRTDDLRDLLTSTCHNAQNWMGEQDKVVAKAQLGGGAGHEGNMFTGEKPFGLPLGVPLKAGEWMHGAETHGGHTGTVSETLYEGGTHISIFQVLYKDMTGIEGLVIPTFKSMGSE